MINIFLNFVFYTGTPGWGWIMYGIGWKTKWFFGLSIQDDKYKSQSVIND